MDRHSISSGVQPRRPIAGVDPAAPQAAAPAPAQRARDSRAATAVRLIASVPAGLRASLSRLLGGRGSSARPSAAAHVVSEERQVERADSFVAPRPVSRPRTTINAVFAPETAAALLDASLNALGLNSLSPEFAESVRNCAHAQLRVALDRAADAQTGPSRLFSENDIHAIGAHAYLLVACANTLHQNGYSEDEAISIASRVSRIAVDRGVEPDPETALQLANICLHAAAADPTLRGGGMSPRSARYIHEEIYLMLDVLPGF